MKLLSLPKTADAAARTDQGKKRRNEKSMPQQTSNDAVINTHRSSNYNDNQH